MIQRFLEYSLRRQRPVKLVWLTDEGVIQSGNLTVTRLGSDEFEYLSAKNRKKPQTMQIECLLSAAYARGDDGDTMKNTLREQEEPHEE